MREQLCQLRWSQSSDMHVSEVVIRHSCRDNSVSGAQSCLLCATQDDAEGWEQARQRKQLVAATFRTMFPDSYQFTLPVHDHMVRRPHVSVRPRGRESPLS